jgi:hypothetical protein
MNDNGITLLPTETFDIVPTHLAVQAMRDNGYKNAAYALAELMDNAIQAGAKNVELLCAEKDTLVNQRTRKKVDQIAVLDDGSGMTADVLRMALQFGNGTRLDPTQHNGIGRFGMGLPASSISQCTRVDVWTWQSGVESAIHTYLDLHEIRERRLGFVPTPQAKQIDPLWQEAGQTFADSGTLVVWSQLDRCRWSSARALIDNTEKVIGRMYRKFLDKGKVRIRFVSLHTGDLVGTLTERYALPNDPGYLMPVTSCPAPFDTKPMFQPWEEKGGSYEETFDIPYNGKRHRVTARFSYARDEARTGHNSGDSSSGRHAKENIGVSIVRAGRELELDQGFVIQYDTTERWWGVEVDFPPALDELFGVTNNKQSARHFADLAKVDIEALLKDATIHEVMASMTADDDPRGPLLQVASKIKNGLSGMRGLIRLQGKGNRTAAETEGDPAPPAPPRAEAKATVDTTRRKQEGHVGRSDKDENLPPAERRETIEQTMLADGANPTEAKTKAHDAIQFGLKYIFAHAELDAAGFFSVKSVGGAIIITLNTAHPAYKNLVETLEDNTPTTDAALLQERLENAADGLKLLLTAWARYEDELPEGARKQTARDARNDWGRVARTFLARDE